jgi:protein-S-isoprenylcysteine O-methyltransferase Ste14
MHLRRAQQQGSPGQVLLLTGAYALIHSLLASRQAKRLAECIVGRRYRNGLYRGFYIVQATVTTAWGIRLFLCLPDRELYHARAPWSYVLGAIQISGAALLASAISIVGFRRLTGLEQAAALLRGVEPNAEPEAQGPPPTATGEIDARGPFRHIRHPDNLPIILMLCAFPRMTVNRLTLAVISSLYAVLGSWHEDSRMRAAYGKPFEDYCRRVPMMIPRLRGAAAHNESKRPW